ncbi:MAG: hypothetical protein J6Y31_02915 [Bacteroidales bacterium]|nr:hypothetical protein [Bacteroidales bacterium]
MDKKKVLKKAGIALGIILFFLGVSYGLVPQLLEGKIVNQSDISGYQGMARESQLWNSEHPDDPALWTGSMFSGMPTTSFYSVKKGDWTQPLYDFLLIGRRPATYFFIALLGAFLLMLSLGISWPLAVGGALAVALCSYNFQIIQVGHNTKMQAIAYFPWVLAALVFCYRSIHREKGWLWSSLAGAALFGVALSLQIKANHQQITYYLAFVVFLYALAELIHCIRSRRFGHFVTASALLLVLGVAGIGTNANKLLPLAKYTPHTMRGGSELSEGGSGGLDLGYATAWSYGWQELPNLMIPNFNGGSSAQAVNPDKSETVKLLKRAGQRNVRETAKALPMYWGPQPFTAGPMYMGALSVFLFVLGLGLVKSREKWWLLASSILAVLMALGSHFMPFTEFCFKYLPLYNKFRTVSMALIVLQVTLPALGFIALDGIVRGRYGKADVRKPLITALAISGGFCLLCCLFPGLFGSFSAASDAGQPEVLREALRADRIALFRADALRSLLLVAVGGGALFWGVYKPSRLPLAAALVCVLAALNLAVTGHRYLNSDHFVSPKDFKKPFAERPVDAMILADTDPSYRVLDLSQNVFNSSVPSYRHKNVGGYSPAKLQRYQDLIDRYLSREINSLYDRVSKAETMDEVSDYMASGTPVLNLLNTRYVILDGKYPPLGNYAAAGNAWLVDGIRRAATPDQELSLLASADLGSEAVVGADFSVPEPAAPEDGSIVLETYSPNELVYNYDAPEGAVAVFSEIYYPGWTATLEDGRSVPLFRADWTLRGAVLPGGEHRLTLRFAPSSYRSGVALSRASSALLLILLLAAAGLFVYNTKRI